MTSTRQIDIDGTKRKNIIDMSMGFTAMTRVFSPGSMLRIKTRIEEAFELLSGINSQMDYELLHGSFCEWFVREVQTAPKALKNGNTLASAPASYGQGAKVWDIVIKVYVYYCSQPSPEAARRILPFLNGAIDTPILEFLRHSQPSIKAKTIKQIDKTLYLTLQEVIVTRSRELNLLPVQFDDLMWRRLNRKTDQT